jgi:hypothetical protein
MLGDAGNHPKPYCEKSTSAKGLVPSGTTQLKLNNVQKNKNGLSLSLLACEKERKNMIFYTQNMKNSCFMFAEKICESHDSATG